MKGTRAALISATMSCTLLVACASQPPSPRTSSTTENADINGAGAEQSVASTINTEAGLATTASRSDAQPRTHDEGRTILGQANQENKDHLPEQLGQLIVRSVRIGSHEGFDRIVFDLEGEGEPGWHARLTNTPQQQGSGRPIPYTGTQALELTLHGTPVPESIEPGAGFESIPAGLIPNTQAGLITGVTATGIFEADSVYVIGLAENAAYTISYLPAPKRIVVDVVGVVGTVVGTPAPQH